MMITCPIHGCMVLGPGICPQCEADAELVNKINNAERSLIRRCPKHHKDFTGAICPECEDDLLDSMIADDPARDPEAYETMFHIAGEKGNMTEEEARERITNRQWKEFDPNGKKPSDPGSKLDGGKPLAGVLGDFALALMAVAEVGTHGAEKYSRGGWQSVPDAETRYHDAEWRHLLKRRHEDYDKDSGLLHDAHRAWNVLAQLELRLRKTKSEATKKRLEEMMFPKDVTWKDDAPGCPHTRTKFVKTTAGDYRQCLGCGARLEVA